MARVKMTEYRAKKLILGDDYRGFSLANDAALPALKGHWVAKVDEGVKKRFKQGLVAIGSRPALAAAIRGWRKKGFSNFIVEPFVAHDERDEQYLSLERVRDGVRILYAQKGGIDVEAHPEAVRTFLVREPADVKDIARATKIPQAFLARLVQNFEKHFFGFLELNPLVVRAREAHPLDAAALVDSASAFFARGAWDESDLVKARARHKAEARVEALDATTPASLKLSVLNKNGSIFLLLSAGGGSIVIADEAQLRGAGNDIGNYGEYSGGPTREETYLYAKEVIGLLLASSAKRKALVIAGPVANFTDVKRTFLGIVDALSERAAELRAAKTKVFVRRGGPNEAAGLELMREFLAREKLLGSVHGSEAVITEAIDEAVGFARV